MIAGGAVIAALGTVAVAVFAQVQIKDERSARQHTEAEQRSAEIRKQAEQVTAWTVATNNSGFPTSPGPFGRQVTYVDLNNGSSAPVYGVVVSLVFVQGAGPRTGQELSAERRRVQGYPGLTQRTLLDIPPGRTGTYVNGEWPGMSKRAGIEIAFTDQAGYSWVRYSNGSLESIAKRPLEYYGLEEPGEFATPEKAH
jgi:hypothetical protein